VPVEARGESGDSRGVDAPSLFFTEVTAVLSPCREQDRSWKPADVRRLLQQVGDRVRDPMPDPMPDPMAHTTADGAAPAGGATRDVDRASSGSTGRIDFVDSECELVEAALALGARDVRAWSRAELDYVKKIGAKRRPATSVADLKREIRHGGDPLGDAYTTLRSPEERRPHGATYTPHSIVDAMVEWAASNGAPGRVVDPGTGSARFLVAAGRKFRRVPLIGVEITTLGSILARGHLAAAGLAERSTICACSYHDFAAPPIDAKTLYVGNPPYVRHHQIPAMWKDWLARTARARGLKASQLAGLHVHFFLATAARASRDDFGAFITSAEWLDVNYGSLVRELLLDGLGGLAVHVLEPTVTAFEDAATTAAITCFRVGSRPKSIRLRRVKTVEELGKLDGGRLVRRERLIEARRWTPFTRAPRKMPEGYVELGELCRVHRGAVTGSNATWVVATDFDALPEHVLFPTVTRARELFAAQHVLDGVAHLRRVIDLPVDLDMLDVDDRKKIDKFLRTAKRRGAANGYIARQRKAWWSVGLKQPAPILATYMARRPPVFVRNLSKARHINIAHGLYPRQPMTARALERLARHLSETVTLGQGRMYAGGLTKFEPKEMERLPIPDLAFLTT
jgi:adenine-specific DNA-methyltransferase